MYAFERFEGIVSRGNEMSLRFCFERAVEFPVNWPVANEDLRLACNGRELLEIELWIGYGAVKTLF